VGFTTGTACAGGGKKQVLRFAQDDKPSARSEALRVKLAKKGAPCGAPDQEEALCFLKKN